MIKINEIKEGDLPMRAGVVITDGKCVLGCLPTPTKKWLNSERRLDLPKGHMELGETPSQSAVRECYEETGIILSEKSLNFVGEFTVYGEPFFLFIVKINFFPELTKLHCPSTFKTNSTERREVSAYSYVPFSKVESSFQTDLSPIVIKALQKLTLF